MQYEALRAFFIEGLPSAEAATRFGYTPGSFRVLVHHFQQYVVAPDDVLLEVMDKNAKAAGV